MRTVHSSALRGTQDGHLHSACRLPPQHGPAAPSISFLGVEGTRALPHARPLSSRNCKLRHALTVARRPTRRAAERSVDVDLSPLLSPVSPARRRGLSLNSKPLPALCPLRPTTRGDASLIIATIATMARRPAGTPARRVLLCVVFIPLVRLGEQTGRCLRAMSRSGLKLTACRRPRQVYLLYQAGALLSCSSGGVQRLAGSAARPIEPGAPRQSSPLISASPCSGDAY